MRHAKPKEPSMHRIQHDSTTTITSDSPLYDVAQMTDTSETPYSVIVDGVEYRSASPMHVVKTTYSGIYTDAYLFDVASHMLDAGHSSVDVVEHIVSTCGVERDAATRIVSLAFDPSSSAR